MLPYIHVPAFLFFFPAGRRILEVFFSFFVLAKGLGSDV